MVCAIRAGNRAVLIRLIVIIDAKMPTPIRQATIIKALTSVRLATVGNSSMPAAASTRSEVTSVRRSATTPVSADGRCFVSRVTIPVRTTSPPISEGRQMLAKSPAPCARKESMRPTPLPAALRRSLHFAARMIWKRTALPTVVAQSVKPVFFIAATRAPG